MNQDAEHLRLVSIFHYVHGVLVGLGSSVFIVHAIMGALMAFSPDSFADNNGPPPPAPVGALFMLIGGGAVLAGWTVAILQIVAGRSLARRTRYVFCLVVAGIDCAFTPLGTALGIFTIIILTRQSVKRLYGRPSALPGPPYRPPYVGGT